jgi:hypothetical protein
MTLVEGEEAIRVERDTGRKLLGHSTHTPNVSAPSQMVQRKRNARNNRNVVKPLDMIHVTETCAVRIYNADD